jgi:hypothetical protein
MLQFGSVDLPIGVELRLGSRVRFVRRVCAVVVVALCAVFCATGCSSTGALIITGGVSPNGTVGVAYYSTLTVTNGTGTYAWTVANLPPGVTASGTSSATLVLSGTPTTAGSYTMAATVTDSKLRTDTVTDGITISTSPVLTINGTLPFTGSVGTAYSGTLTATGGTAPYTWTIENLPPGLTAAGANTSTLSVTGSPTTAGSFVVAITLTDSLGATAKAGITIAISSAAGLAITGSLPATGTVGAAYSGALTATGGTAPYMWAVSNLPPGVSDSGLDTATVSVAGTPTGAATYNVTALVTDAKLNTALYSVTVVVGAGQNATDLACTTPASPLGNEAAITEPYAFVMSGLRTDAAPVSWMGSFTPDGKGGIVAADLDETSQTTGPASFRVNLQGSSYSFGSDGKGCLYLALSGMNAPNAASTHPPNRELGGGAKISLPASAGAAGPTSSFAVRFTVGAAKRGGTIAQIDPNGKYPTALGRTYEQTAGDFSLEKMPARIAFGASGWYLGAQSEIERAAMAGSIGLDARTGAMLDGAADNNIGGDVSGELYGASGLLTSPSSATGRGTGTYTVETARGEVSFDFAYYVLGAGNFIFISTDTAEPGNFLLTGRALTAATQNPRLAGHYWVRLAGIAVDSSTTAQIQSRTNQTANVSISSDGAAKFDWLTKHTNQAQTDTAADVTAETESSTGRTTFQSTRAGLPVAYLTSTTGEEAIRGFLVGTDDTAARGILYLSVHALGP